MDSFMLCFFFTSKFISLYFFLSLIILIPQDCHKSILKSTIKGTVMQII